jgi:[acyl-carrier-protein] S-malonyltransferase
LLKSAGVGLSKVLAEIKLVTPLVPYTPNVIGKVLAEPDGEEIAALLVEQVTQPVRWHDCVCAMIGFGVKEIVEVGPGRVLTRLVRRIDRQVDSKTFQRIE